ncbi:MULTISPECIES: hypothetical protein [unclassified Pseudomonas]|uniref:hypothetical protein n=1 Tax=unclassified Pseudomonas TaxID=196821 RepID=UPI002AC97A4B|nr:MULTISPECIES: hypothetical protein [unclassified Pseudomonas]MEB0040878.1 hypothetical protein [Pseudomonas sp. MH10]MEB0079576.1 hypothetical protein [Pseudomonas sp. MH10out]MEB0090194.1 hypothetical protein [Pseudomonas sp. CCI4.2]MEB0102673.1 hypothetical protein [Pseudomonas sp. CCI3.2]MEB0119441.1 hypothetical protein [Pseudomonas sp. CCI1.2]
MKKLYLSAAVATLIATTSGCVSYNMSQPTAPISGSVTADLKANVKVGEKITGESSTNILFGWLSVGGDTQFADGVTYGGAGAGGSALSLPDPISAVKAAAAYKAVKSSGSDLIVAPRYEVNVEDYFIFKKVNVKVTGNKGSIDSIR